MIAPQLELLGLAAVLRVPRRRFGGGYPAASCVVASCALCHRAFNPLRGPCGTLICPVCLLELATSDRAQCSPCCDVDLCPVQRGHA